MGIRLTSKRSEFVNAVLRAKQAGERNPELAAVKVAYPTAKERSQKVMASKYRHDRGIQAEIAARSTSPDELIRRCWLIADDPGADRGVQLEALKEIDRLKNRQLTNSQNGKVGSAQYDAPSGPDNSADQKALVPGGPAFRQGPGFGANQYHPMAVDLLGRRRVGSEPPRNQDELGDW